MHLSRIGKTFIIKDMDAIKRDSHAFLNTQCAIFDHAK